MTIAQSRRVPIQQAAEHAACSVKTIRRLVASGKLTGYRLGPRLIRIDLQELDAIMRPIPTVGGDAA